MAIFDNYLIFFLSFTIAKELFSIGNDKEILEGPPSECFSCMFDVSNIMCRLRNDTSKKKFQVAAEKLFSRSAKISTVLKNHPYTSHHLLSFSVK